MTRCITWCFFSFDSALILSNLVGWCWCALTLNLLLLVAGLRYLKQVWVFAFALRSFAEVPLGSVFSYMLLAQESFISVCCIIVALGYCALGFLVGFCIVACKSLFGLYLSELRSYSLFCYMYMGCNCYFDLMRIFTFYTKNTWILLELALTSLVQYVDIVWSSCKYALYILQDMSFLNMSFN